MSSISSLSRWNSYCLNYFDFLSSKGICLISPKQAFRQETTSETLWEVGWKIHSNLSFHIWKASSYFAKSLVSKEMTDYMQIMTLFSKDPVDGTEMEKTLLEPLVLQASSRKNFLDYFDFIVTYNQNQQLRQQHHLLKNLFFVSHPEQHCKLIDKFTKLIQVTNIDEMESLEEQDKLTRFDVNVLASIKTAKSVLNKVQSFGISCREIDDRISALVALSEHPFFNDLGRLCLENLKPGMICMGDRRTLQINNGIDFFCTKLVQHVFMGRMTHIGIFVNPDEKEMKISHVNMMTMNHAITPIKSLLMLPFLYSLSLNIRPLIPEAVREEDKNILVRLFEREFHEIASVKHPELTLSGSEQHLKMLAMGHKSFFSTKLEEIDLPEGNTAIMCSSYVGIVFLMAVKKMNEYLEQQGYSDRIAHPFGEHENIMHLDILRLIYLWDQLDLIKPSERDEKLAKVFTSISVLRRNC